MVEETLLSDDALLRQLNANPLIKHRVMSLLAVIQDAEGDLKEADAAEMRLIEEIRHMGQEALQSWASSQVEATGQALRQSGQVHREGKKNCAGTRPSETSA
jgi:hypothetical protein